MQNEVPATPMSMIGMYASRSAARHNDSFMVSTLYTATVHSTHPIKPPQLYGSTIPGEQYQASVVSHRWSRTGNSAPSEY